MSAKVMMIGWELPPHNSGGLGVACYGLARALAEKGVNITFVLPKKVDLNVDFANLVFANIKEIQHLKHSYTTSSKYLESFNLKDTSLDFVNAALLYGLRMKDIAMKCQADVIHAHDWLTFPAGVAAKQVLNKPLVTHIHSTEFDRTGGHYPNKVVYEIEREGLNKADRIISVSEFTKNILVQKYGIRPRKIDVVHNGVEEFNKSRLSPVLTEMKAMGYKIVMYLGRITLQKGPEYFVRSAKKVLKYNPKTMFIVVGSGDMQEQMMKEAANLGILEKMVFTGFLRGDEKDRVWQSADLYVLPSVSEPFGITALESIANGTPVLVSKQSGVSEVLNHILKVDFWDIDEMANKIIAVLKYPPLRKNLQAESSKELPNINWGQSAQKCLSIYNQLIR